LCLLFALSRGCKSAEHMPLRENDWIIVEDLLDSIKANANDKDYCGELTKFIDDTTFFPYKYTVDMENHVKMIVRLNMLTPNTFEKMCSQGFRATTNISFQYLVQALKYVPPYNQDEYITIVGTSFQRLIDIGFMTFTDVDFQRMLERYEDMCTVIEIANCCYPGDVAEIFFCRRFSSLDFVGGLVRPSTC